MGDKLTVRTATLPLYAGQPPQFIEVLMGNLRTTYEDLPPPNFDRLIAQFFLTLPHVMEESTAYGRHHS